MTDNEQHAAHDAIYPDLTGKAVLVTGGGWGIGASLVEHFARQRACVRFLDRNEERGAALTDALRDQGFDVAFRRVDLVNIPETVEVIRDLEHEVGAFRGLVNNAGDDSRHDWREVSPDYWDDRFAVNVRHQFFAAQAVAPGMAKAGGGAIINMGSTAWMFGAAGLIAYAAAKSAIEGLTKSLARELGPMRIRVNAIAPGFILTEKQQERVQMTSPGKLDEFLQRQCVKEHLEPADVAKLALWLTSGEAPRCTGQTFILDGGVV